MLQSHLNYSGRAIKYLTYTCYKIYMSMGFKEFRNWLVRRRCPICKIIQQHLNFFYPGTCTVRSESMNWYYNTYNFLSAIKIVWCAVNLRMAHCRPHCDIENTFHSLGGATQCPRVTDISHNVTFYNSIIEHDCKSFTNIF